jgi:tetratricopeptide (TPR) repeat protein
MTNDSKRIDTGGGAAVGGNVSTGGGDFVGRDKIEQLVENMKKINVQGDYIEKADILNVLLVTDAVGLEELITRVSGQQGLHKTVLLGSMESRPPENIDRQVQEIQAAAQEVTAKGVPLTPQAAYHLGMLAAYRRDYDEAVNYFRLATSSDTGFDDAYEALTWIQQSRAMDDIKKKDYEAAIRKLSDARDAAIHTDPLDAHALALRGYIDKSLAQIYHGRKDVQAEKVHYAEAERLFNGAVKLDPRNPSAFNGLGNVQHARGELDQAINSYKKAIELAPNYAAAWYDLAGTYQEKMKADKQASWDWARKALEAWREVYRLAPDDPLFSAEDILEIGQRIRWFEKQLGEN